MKIKIVDILDWLVIGTIFYNIFFNYTDQGKIVMALCFWYMAIRKIIERIKNPLPKPIYVLNRNYITMLYGLGVIIFILGEGKNLIGDNYESDIFVWAMLPIFLSNYVRTPFYGKYLCEKGVVIDKKLFEYKSIKSFSWKDEVLHIEIEDESIDIEISSNIKDNVQKIFEENVKGKGET